MTGMISQSLTWPMEYVKIKRQMNGKSIMDNFKYEYKNMVFVVTRGLGSHLEVVFLELLLDFILLIF